jgi:hypothetical protein
MTYPAGDHLQILNTVHSYTFAVDDKDIVALRNVFHPDAVIRAFGQAFSVDQYCEAIPRLVERMNSCHKISNEVVTIDGDRAVCRSYLLAYHGVPADLDDQGADAIFGEIDVDTDSLILGGYRDTLEKRDGAWKIVEKAISMKWQQHLPTLPPFPGWAGM